MFGSALDKILTQLHLNKEHFNTHSFRIGATTSAKQAGMSESWEDGLPEVCMNVTEGLGRPIQETDS